VILCPPPTPPPSDLTSSSSSSFIENGGRANLDENLHASPFTEGLSVDTIQSESISMNNIFNDDLLPLSLLLISLQAYEKPYENFVCTGGVSYVLEGEDQWKR
jgi:hypothetical protein